MRLAADLDNADDRQRAQVARDFKRCPVPQRLASNERSLFSVAPLPTRGGLAGGPDSAAVLNFGISVGGMPLNFYQAMND